MPPAADANPLAFQIHNFNADGKCIGIANGLAGDWWCTNNPDQTWHWGAANAAGWQHLVNGDNQCLAVNGVSTADGARILGYLCVDSLDQYWMPAPFPASGQLYIVNHNSRKIVGVDGGSTDNGAALVQWPPQAPPAQLWNGP